MAVKTLLNNRYFNNKRTLNFTACFVVLVMNDFSRTCSLVAVLVRDHKFCKLINIMMH